MFYRKDSVFSSNNDAFLQLGASIETSGHTCLTHINIVHQWTSGTQILFQILGCKLTNRKTDWRIKFACEGIFTVHFSWEIVLLLYIPDVWQAYLSDNSAPVKLWWKRNFCHIQGVWRFDQFGFPSSSSYNLSLTLLGFVEQYFFPAC